jgi:hypothetical protein
VVVKQTAFLDGPSQIVFAQLWSVHAYRVLSNVQECSHRPGNQQIKNLNKWATGVTDSEKLGGLCRSSLVPNGSIVGLLFR